MKLNLIDIIFFISFIILVVVISMVASRKKKTSSSDYFLAGRGLTWWLIAFSLIASNISTEHFVGMAGAGFGEAGLAIASYEWIAAVTLVFVALFLLPFFLRLGIYTMPEFLEHRYGPQSRMIMAIFMIIAYVGVAMVAVIYSGAIGLKTIFGLDLRYGIWMIGILSGIYTIYGGLKAVVWSDLIQGSTLLIGGLFVTLIALSKVGGLDVFLTESADKLHTILPADHSEIPFTALFLGIWIPNLFYWGFNQFITQRTLGAKSIKEGQIGIIVAALIKLVIPFIIVFPGIIAYQLYASEIPSGDQAYPFLIKKLLPIGFRGLMFAALFGAIMSSLDSMLNSASTIFTIDIYKKHLNKKAESKRLVKIGRISTAILAIMACILGPLPEILGEGVFNYIQKIWGFISPGIVVVFIFGFIFRRAPQMAANIVMIAGIFVYAVLLYSFPKVAFLNHMAFTFIVLVMIMGIVTMIKPLKKPATFSDKNQLKGEEIDLSTSLLAKILGGVVVILTIMLYVYFR